MTTIIINTPIESRHPAEVASVFGKDLDARQQRILDMLPGYGSEIIVKKRDVSMLDLAAMTAATGDEFAMFTKGGERLIVRGNTKNVPLSDIRIIGLRNEGFRWSGHTHPGIHEVDLFASGGDMEALRLFNQKQSVVYNSFGRHRVFGQEE